MRIAYGKLGRSIPLSSGGASNVGGDIEVIRLLEILLRDHEVHLVTRNRSDLKHPNLVNHWDASDRNSTFYDAINASRGMQRFPDDPKFIEYSHLIKTKALELPEFDEWFIWLGQHGSTLSYLPRVQMSRKELDPRLKGVTRPLISDVNYGFPIISILNTLKVQPRWLCPDPRNRVKFRDLNEPKQHDILSQFDTKKANTFYSPEHGLRRGTTSYKYSGIELLAVPPPVNGMTSECPWVGEEPYRHRFGLLVNEGYHNLGRKNRLEFVKEWVPVSRTPVSEMEIFGHWSPSSKAELGMDIEPVALKYVDDV